MGHAGPAFEDGEAAQRALTDHYQRVAQVLADDPESYAPVFDADAHTAEVFWEPWIVGFGRAMGLRRARPGIGLCKAMTWTPPRAPTSCAYGDDSWPQVGP